MAKQSRIRHRLMGIREYSHSADLCAASLLRGDIASIELSCVLRQPVVSETVLDAAVWLEVE